MINTKKFNLKYTQISALGFAAIIFMGAILLMLPISSRSGEVTPFINALFTSASATCVTGLVVYDTFTHFSLFGQIIILALIQIGGLGFMLIATLFSLMLKRRIGLKTRGLLKESVSTITIGGVVRLTKNILKCTLVFEGIGAIILAFRFYGEMGFSRAVYNGIFHSISAFCNAGFDLMGRFEPSSSLTRFRGDIVVNLVVMALIVIGGIGFLVWQDLWVNKFKFSKYKLHTKIVLVATIGLIIFPTIIFYFMERKNLFLGMPAKDIVLSSLFQIITPRTAGFNTLNIASLTESSKLLTMILMVIGGSPGSTAGGIKTTTFVIIIFSFISSLRHTQDLNIFNRRLENEIVKRAYNVGSTYLFGVVTSVLFICAVQPLKLTDVFFEVFSALSTVGMTTGITSKLIGASKLVIIILMFCGRVGSLTIALAFTEKRETIPVRLPIEKISI